MTESLNQISQADVDRVRASITATPLQRAKNRLRIKDLGLAMLIGAPIRRNLDFQIKEVLEAMDDVSALERLTEDKGVSKTEFSKQRAEMHLKVLQGWADDEIEAIWKELIADRMSDSCPRSTKEYVLSEYLALRDVAMEYGSELVR